MQRKKSSFLAFTLREREMGENKCDRGLRAALVERDFRVGESPLGGAQSLLARAQRPRSAVRSARPGRPGTAPAAPTAPPREGACSVPRALRQRWWRPRGSQRERPPCSTSLNSGSAPTRSAWAVNAGSAITSSLGTRSEGEAGMSAVSRARREEGQDSSCHVKGRRNCQKCGREHWGSAGRAGGGSRGPQGRQSAGSG